MYIWIKRNEMKEEVYYGKNKVSIDGVLSGFPGQG